MNKTILIVLIILMGHCHLASSQIITVIDIETGVPIELVTINSDAPRVSSITNSKGQANIDEFRDAEKIEFHVFGYTSEIRSYADLQNQGDTVKLKPSSINIDEIVVSASFWDQKSSEVPNKVVSIPPKVVSIHNPQTAADLLSISGKVFVQKSQQGGGSPMIRGFATNRLLYTIDGVRMNTAIFRGGNIQNIISLDPFAIEHTEVLFGPGSVIYGSDAIGGVMSFQTLQPQLSFTPKPFITGSAAIRFASANDEKTSHFHISIGGQKWASITSISYNNYGDLKMGSYGPDEYLRPFYVQRHDSVDVVVKNQDERIQTPSGYTQMNLMQKVRYAPTKNLNIVYGFHYSETSDYDRYDRHIRYKKGLPRYGEWKYGPQVWVMNNVSITHKNHVALYDQLSVRLAQQHFEESRISRDFNKVNRETRIEKVNAYSANLDLVKTFRKHKILYGAEAVVNEVNSKGIDEDIATGLKVNGPARYPQSLWQSYAAYVSDQLKLNAWATLHTGIRYNQYVLEADFDTTFYPFPFTRANIHNKALTGSIGLVMRRDDNLVVSVNASTAYRSPNVDDIGKVFDSEPGSVTVPNPGLKAEYAYNFDLGIAKVIADLLRIDATGYYTQLKNAMVRRNYQLNGLNSIYYDGELSQVQAIQNAAVANVYGMQAGLTLKLPAGFGLSSDFNFQKGEEELDDGTTSPSRHAAPCFGTTRLTYGYNKVNIKFYAVYSGKKSFGQLPEEEKGKDYMYAIDADGNPYSPAWYTLNFKALYQLNEQFSISAGVENITDQRYRPYSSGIVAPGRNFIMSARANF